MYEQVAHSLLNEILDLLKPEVRRQDLRHFYTRLGANFYAIHRLFQHLYGDRDDTTEQMVRLVEVLADGYIDRSESLERSDMEREGDHNWFLSQEWVGMALYSGRFCRRPPGRARDATLPAGAGRQHGPRHADAAMPRGRLATAAMRSATSARSIPPSALWKTFASLPRPCTRAACS